MTAQHREIEQSGTVDGLYYEVLRPAAFRQQADSEVHTTLDARPLLVLPGFLSDGRQVKRLLREIGRRSVVVDPLGAGRSAGPLEPEEYGWPRQATRLLRLLDALGWGQVDLLGMSMGGMWAQQVLLASPQRFATTVLVATAARLNARMRSILLGLRALWVCGVPRLDVWRVLAPLLFSPEFLDRPSAVAMLEMLATDARSHSARAEEGRVLPLLQLDAMLAHDTLDRLAALASGEGRSRTGGRFAILGGAGDILMPPSVQHELAGALATVSPSIVPGAGHTLWIERPTELAALVRTALAVDAG